jgi:hypothetical protein
MAGSALSRCACCRPGCCALTTRRARDPSNGPPWERPPGAPRCPPVANCRRHPGPGPGPRCDAARAEYAGHTRNRWQWAPPAYPEVRGLPFRPGRQAPEAPGRVPGASALWAYLLHRGIQPTDWEAACASAAIAVASRARSLPSSRISTFWVQPIGSLVVGPTSSG